MVVVNSGIIPTVFEESNQSQNLTSTGPVLKGLNVGDILNGTVGAYFAYGFLFEIKSPDLPPFLKNKTALIHSDLLEKYFSKTMHSDFIQNGDEFEVCVASLPSEKQKQIFLDLTQKTILFLQERRMKSLVDSNSSST